VSPPPPNALGPPPSVQAWDTAGPPSDDIGPTLYEGYGTEVLKTFKGEGKAVVNTVTGIASAVLNLRQTARGLWYAAWHPIETGQRIGSALLRGAQITRCESSSRDAGRTRWTRFPSIF